MQLVLNTKSMIENQNGGKKNGKATTQQNCPFMDEIGGILL